MRTVSIPFFPTFLQSQSTKSLTPILSTFLSPYTCRKFMATEIVQQEISYHFRIIRLSSVESKPNLFLNDQLEEKKFKIFGCDLFHATCNRSFWDRKKGSLKERKHFKYLSVCCPISLLSYNTAFLSLYFKFLCQRPLLLLPPANTNNFLNIKTFGLARHEKKDLCR